MILQELFEAMPGRFNAAAAAGLNKTLQFRITGEEPGVWTIRIADSAAHLIQDAVENPDVTFTVDGKDWQAMEAGKLNTMNAFMAGKLKVTGDMGLAIKVPQIFPLKK
jgi:putative sterol carrier protein